MAQNNDLAEAIRKAREVRFIVIEKVIFSSPKRIIMWLCVRVREWRFHTYMYMYMYYLHVHVTYISSPYHRWRLK